MNFVSALEILRVASAEELQCHFAQTILTLREVGQRLQVRILPTVASRQSDIEGGDPNPASCTTKQTRAKTIPLSAEEKLLRSLSTAVFRLWTIRNENISDIIGRKRLLARDRRIDDITRVEGDPSAPTGDTLLRTCAWISYASEFTKHQECNGDRVRVDHLVRLLLGNQVDSRSFREGQGGTISKYVRGSDQFIGREQFFSLAIGNGIKLFTVKKLLEEKLQHRELEVNCHAILLALGLVYSQVKSTTYKNLGQFVDLLLSEEALVSLPGEESCARSCADLDEESDISHSRKRHILDILRELSTWSKAFQTQYDSRTPSFQNVSLALLDINPVSGLLHQAYRS
ncbi:hypothetical protein EYZ11_012510 [Aspergillus tanneri]|uniref:Uncharacterized protein n=1 Tax=Aspergillus tanneri TaxID=1220188 RepID=A0A4S3J032_9EURO|nr:hypothetical protein EYZ11_012510 [Aspergillus tanneri]